MFRFCWACNDNKYKAVGKYMTWVDKREQCLLNVMYY